MNSEKVIGNIKKAIKEHLDNNYAYDMLVDFELDVIDWNSLFEYIDKLQQENKKLNGAIQTYDILLKSNTEENKQLKDNWNKLKKFLEEWKENEEYCYLATSPIDRCRKDIYGEILDKMQELEQGSDSNE